jgi:hypothetical protein
MLLCVCVPPIVVYARRSQTSENVNGIRYTQIILKLNGVYTWPIDGRCNTLTQQAIKQAIEKYKDLPTTTSSGAICSIKFIKGLNDKLIESLSSGTSEPDRLSQNTTGERNLASLSADITNIKSTIKGINDTMSDHFISLSFNMATVAITTLLAGNCVNCRDFNRNYKYLYKGRRRGVTCPNAERVGNRSCPNAERVENRSFQDNWGC